MSLCFLPVAVSAANYFLGAAVSTTACRFFIFQAGLKPSSSLNYMRGPQFFRQFTVGCAIYSIASDILKEVMPKNHFRGSIRNILALSVAMSIVTLVSVSSRFHNILTIFFIAVSLFDFLEVNKNRGAFY